MIISIPRSVRRGPLIFLICVCLILGVLLHRSRFLIGLLFEDGAPDIINPVDLLDHWDPNATHVYLIPKIIHQTNKNRTIPYEWQKGQNATLNLHPDYEYKFWTDEDAHDFIATEYAWFLPTYDTYRYPIQRVDAFRYFVLYHYGGTYMDLDIEPYHRLDPLRTYPAFACRTAPTGISNDAIGTMARHPFYWHIIRSLESYNRNWLLPYITIMYSTGPLFLSVMWREYIRFNPPPSAEAKIWSIMRGTHFEDTYGFFYNNEGGSWHGKDMEVIFWMGEHWLLVTVLGVAGGLGVMAVGWWTIKKLSERSKGYRRLQRSA